MKRIRLLSLLVLVLMLVSSLTLFSQAEPANNTSWHADIPQLMDPEDVPSTSKIQIENTYAEGAEIDTHDVACEVTINGVTYGCEFTFEMNGIKIVDWASTQQWLGGLITEAARTAGGDTETLAKAIEKAMEEGRKNAVPDESGALPLWAQSGLAVSEISVSTPYFPTLKEGKNGEATIRLQKRLIELGYLTGEADGLYGQKTSAAVMALENYVRELEQDLIDVHAKELVQATPTAAAVAQNDMNSAAPSVLNATKPTSTHELTLTPRETEAPEATAAPTAAPTAAATTADADMEAAADVPTIPGVSPMTPVDGVADALLQAYIFSDAYQTARRALQNGDTGDDVTRMQNRLLSLGCMSGIADGNYGGSTARSVRVFQYYNGLNQTGSADMDTLKLLFNAAAKAPDNSMLMEGASGEEVKKLQTRLRVTGFTKISVDGDYGAGTKTAVETLQQYLRNREEAALKAQTTSTDGMEPDVSAQLTYEVNGIADPMLLDDFYSEAFPAIPAAMASGSTGDDVVRLQRRLNALEYYYGALDGDYGSGTASAVDDFQKRNGLTRTGNADITTMQTLFNENALKALKPYILKVSTGDQRVYAYGLDDNNEYTVLVRTMKCSTGRNATPTPAGTFKAGTGPGARWHYFKKFDCWAQYAYYIQGDIMFHSVLYGSREGRVTQSSVNNLGSKASHGCVRLSVEDAKWIYTHCPQNTQVTVY